MALSTLQIEEARLERIMTVACIGIAYKDEQLTMQEYENDPALREMLIEYQRERIHQLRLSEPLPYPQLEE